MQTIIVTQPQEEPVTLAALKSNLRISWSDDDAMLFDMIQAARTWVENGLNRKLITQTLRTAIYLPELLMTPLAGVIGTFDGYAVRLPWNPVQSVSLVEIETQIATWVTLTPTDDYLTDAGDGLPAKIYLATAALAQWAVALNYPGNKPRIRATYVAGYGSDASTVPPNIRRNVLQVAAWMYQNRDSVDSPPETMLDTTSKIFSL